MSTWKLLRSFENFRKEILFEDVCLTDPLTTETVKSMKNVIVIIRDNTYIII